MSATLVAPSNPLIRWSWIRQNAGMIWSATGQHAELSALAVGIGFAIALPLGILSWRFRRLRTPMLAFAGLLYTIPSIALFSLVQPVTGYFTIETAEVALVGYTLLILVRNTIVGLEAVPADVAESAVALGYTPRRQILRVYLPLALPQIFAGLRVATVTVVGLVTVTAFMGQGGLGQLILNGFNENIYTPIVVGLVLSLALAALGDGLFVLLERGVVRWNRSRRR